ncbi:MAG: hypothetical protein WBP58_11365, partial [Chitinophagaceae bacterium]
DQGTMKCRVMVTAGKIKPRVNGILSQLEVDMVIRGMANSLIKVMASKVTMDTDSNRIKVMASKVTRDTGNSLTKATNHKAEGGTLKVEAGTASSLTKATRDKVEVDMASPTANILISSGELVKGAKKAVKGKVDRNNTVANKVLHLLRRDHR